MGSKNSNMHFNCLTLFVQLIVSLEIGDKSISEWDVPKIDKDIDNNNDIKNSSRKSY